MDYMSLIYLFKITSLLFIVWEWSTQFHTATSGRTTSWGFIFRPISGTEPCKKIIEEAQPPLFSRMVREQLKTIILNNAKNIPKEAPITKRYILRRELIPKINKLDPKYREYFLKSRSKKILEQLFQRRNSMISNPIS